MPLTKLSIMAGIFLAATMAVSGQSVSYSTNTITFGYTNRTALLADGWSFIATGVDGTPRNTEITNSGNGAVIVYNPSDNPGVLRIPVDDGYLLLTPNNSRNTLFRSLATNWVSMRLRLSFHPSANYQEANIMLYQDDDDFVWMGHSFSGNERMRFGREFTGALLENTYNVNVLGAPVTNAYLRLDRDPVTDRISGLYSLDGTTWVTVGNFSQAFTNASLAIYAGGSAGGLPNCDLIRLDVISQTTPVSPALVVRPQHLVFNSVAGQPCTNVEALNVVLQCRQNSPVQWTVTNSSPAWLITSTNTGYTPAWSMSSTNIGFMPTSSCDVSVNTTGLAPGIYQGVLNFGATGTTSAAVNVTLIVNTNSRVSLANWQGGRSGAMSVSVDDANFSGFNQLYTNGLFGTYFIWQESHPEFATFYQAGMEIGSHTISHPCFVVPGATMRGEMEGNIAGCVAAIGVPQSQMISFAWPCGVAGLEEQVVASDYFLSARGFNFNQLESPTPYDFMNLKSFNSHEFDPTAFNPAAPPNPPDFKAVLDSAIAQGKWFNLVLHQQNNDDGAITNSVGKDVWVAPIGTVVKYILQRNYTVITNYVENGSYIQFGCYRLPLDPSPMRSFETAINTNDVVTFLVNPSGLAQVTAVFINGTEVPFSTNRSGSITFNALVTTNLQTIILDLLPNTAPVLPAQGYRTVSEQTTLLVTNTATDADYPAQMLTYTLLVTNTVGGGVQTNASIDANGIISWTPTEAQGPGNYVFTTVVTDFASPSLRATNSFTVTVNEINTPPSLPSPGNLVVYGITTLVFTNTATDLDIPVNPLGYRFLAAPSGATMDLNGIITWTPTPAQVPSTNTFTTVVTDTNVWAINTQNLSATNTFTVTVFPYPLVLPTQTSLTINELTNLVVTNSATVLTNVVGSSWLSTNTFLFTYTNRNALLADGWSFFATNHGVGRNTEVTNANQNPILYAQTNNSLGIVMRVPCGGGDLWSSLNNTTNSIFRAPPSNWISARLNLAFGPTVDYQQAYLVLYQDDDNYVGIGLGYIDAEKVILVQEVNGSPTNVAAAGVALTNLSVRLDRDPASGNISGLYSADGTNWVSLGQVSQSLNKPRLGIWVGASGVPYATSQLTADLSRLDIISSNTVDLLTYTLAVTNSGDNSVVSNASINTSGVISWTPTEAQGPGVYSFTTTVSDGRVPPLFATNSFTITVNELNTAPVLTLPPNTNILELAAWSAKATATDVDIPTNLLTFALVSGPSGLTVTTNGVISWTPAEGQGPGVYTVTVSVTDTNPAAVNAKSLSNTNSFQITVSEVNTAPVLPGQSNLVVNELNLMTVTNTATDADVPPNTLTYTLMVTNLADNSVVNNASIDTNGIITWTPTEAQGPGSYSFTTIVKDNGTPNLSATNSFTVSVNEVNAAPALTLPPNTNILEQVLWSATASASDSDLPVNLLTFALVSGPDGLTITTSGVISWTPTPAQGAGAYTVTVSVADTNPAAINAKSLSTTNSFVITVLAPLTVTADNQSRAYRQTNSPLTGTIVGLMNNDNITATFTTTATTNSPVGPYPILPILNDPGSKLGLYIVTTNTGTLTVTNAVLTATANNASRSYGSTNPVFTVNYSGFVAGDSTNVLSGAPVLTTSADTNSPVGVYTITNTMGTLVAPNYTVSLVNGSLTVTGAVLTAT
ncbi:MAG TPA: MBG domain-containing protein, partial [Candidatus Acidoferrum sp.]|nr:MBG domain-containing protein [Candidatus Acidoferrum sp.]